jgi:hypothetical protein
VNDTVCTPENVAESFANMTMICVDEAPIVVSSTPVADTSKPSLADRLKS